MKEAWQELLKGDWDRLHQFCIIETLPHQSSHPTLSELLHVSSSQGDSPSTSCNQTHTDNSIEGKQYDIGFLDRLPQVTSLLMTVSGSQTGDVLPYFSGTACPPEALRLLNTSVPAEQLLAFAERGNVYLFSESRR